MNTIKKTIAVSGASGFIGSAFVNAAHLRGYRLRILGRNPANVGEEFQRLDLADMQAITPSMFEGCFAVVHLGAHIPANQNDTSEARTCFEMNALATLQILKAATQAGVTEFVHTSSANAYKGGVAKADESAPMFPSVRASYYLTSKLAQEIFAEHWGLMNAIKVICLRLSSVYGPGQKKGAIPAMAQAIRRNDKVVLANGGQFGADFVFVDDVVAALMSSLESNFRGSLNIGSGRRSTILEVMSEACDRLSLDRSCLEIGPVSSEYDVGFPALDVRRAVDVLGYSPTSLQQGMKLFVDDIRSRAS